MKYVTYDNVVMAIAKHRGKTFKGIAKCDPQDEFNLEYGKKLARLRCLVKINKSDLAMKKDWYKVLEQRIENAIRQCNKQQAKLIELEDELVNMI